MEILFYVNFFFIININLGLTFFFKLAIFIMDHMINVFRKKNISAKPDTFKQHRFKTD